MLYTTDPESEKLLGLKCRYYLAKEANAPLFILVHGRAGNYDVMWSFRRCIPDNCHIVAPQAFLTDAIGGFSWWEIVNSKAASLEAIEEAALKLKNFIFEFKKKFNLAPSTTYAFGFSQGAALLSLYLQKEPFAFNGVAILAGLVIENRNNQPPQLEHLNIIMAHGENDETIPLEKAKAGYFYLQKLGANIELFTDPVGHKVGAQGIRKVTEWVKLQVEAASVGL